MELGDSVQAGCIVLYGPNEDERIKGLKKLYNKNKKPQRMQKTRY